MSLELILEILLNLLVAGVAAYLIADKAWQSLKSALT
jgi:hypothetical protein